MASLHNPEIIALLQRMAHGMVKGAPQGWQRASFSAHADKHGTGGHGAVNVLANGRSRPGSMRMPKQLQRVFELDDTGADKLAIELMVHPDGRFEAMTSRAIARKSGGAPGEVSHVYVLRPDIRPPDPGDFQAGPAVPTQAGDPQEAVRLLRAYLCKRAEILGREPGRLEDELPAPWDAQTIEDLEGALRVRLPDDLRALYAVADGDGRSRLFDRHPWLGLRELVAWHHTDPWWASGDTWEHHTLGSIRSEGVPRAAVRSSAHRPGWIIFAESTGGDFLAVDMDPAEGGRPGQVIRLGMHHGNGPVYVADSVTELLRLQLAALERGDYTCDVVTGELWIEAGLPERHGDAADGADSGTGDVGAAAEATVHHVLATCDAELAPLAGHPTLAAVTVRSAEAVSMAPLRDCPRLYGLDLSGAAVRDLDVVAEIPGLRYLSMRREQWHQLTESAGRPSDLTAAVLVGAASPGALAAWAEGLGGSDYDIRFHHGRLPEDT
ncbi:SMI1/KNR4 family protein [Nonomuraea sp. NPDC050643]|uniref:SMI1/KNR4 family protein n=1 Tax=Nonomuraea sp. NPDC050643 TaxID=3155660 RepID=UPI0033F25CFE